MRRDHHFEKHFENEQNRQRCCGEIFNLNSISLIKHLEDISGVLNSIRRSFQLIDDISLLIQWIIRWTLIFVNDYWKITTDSITPPSLRSIDRETNLFDRKSFLLNDKNSRENEKSKLKNFSSSTKSIVSNDQVEWDELKKNLVLAIRCSL